MTANCLCDGYKHIKLLFFYHCKPSLNYNWPRVIFHSKATPNRWIFKMNFKTTGYKFSNSAFWPPPLLDLVKRTSLENAGDREEHCGKIRVYAIYKYTAPSDLSSAMTDARRVAGGQINFLSTIIDRLGGTTDVNVQLYIAAGRCICVGILLCIVVNNLCWHNKKLK